MEDNKQQGTSTKGEREFEIGKDEAWTVNLKAITDLFIANMKRTYDEYQDLSLKSARDGQAYLQKVLSDAQQSDNVRQNIANQALQNAVETANMVGKQAVRHGDIAIDRQWNVDEVSTLTAKTGLQQDIVAAAAAAAVAAVLAAMAEKSEAK